jgi:SNARE protein 1
VPGEDPISATLPTDNLLFSVSDVARSSFSSSVSPPLTTLLPPSFPSATKSTTTAVEPRLMQHSTARQRDMADEMALMASQLKKNTVYFAELLAKDQSVVEETGSKLDGNFGSMQKVRVQTKDLNSKTGSSTCVRMLIILVVTFLFMFMVSLIRFSAR